MIRALIEVCDEPGYSTVSVEAETLVAALRIAKESYPDSDARVVFPIDPEHFFLGKPDTRERTAKL